MTSAFCPELFEDAQEGVIGTVYRELVEGRKQTHWMWFVFPQLRILGSSPRARLYGLEPGDQARYVASPLLCSRLEICVDLMIRQQRLCRSPVDVLGYGDSAKLQSCLTLFEAEDVTFRTALDQLFKGRRCKQTDAWMMR